MDIDDVKKALGLPKRVLSEVWVANGTDLDLLAERLGAVRMATPTPTWTTFTGVPIHIDEKGNLQPGVARLVYSDGDEILFPIGGMTRLGEYESLLATIRHQVARAVAGGGWRATRGEEVVQNFWLVHGYLLRCAETKNRSQVPAVETGDWGIYLACCGSWHSMDEMETNAPEGLLLDLVKTEYVEPHRYIDRAGRQWPLDDPKGSLQPVCQLCVAKFGLDVKIDTFECDTSDDRCQVCLAPGRKPTDDDWGTP